MTEEVAAARGSSGPGRLPRLLAATGLPALALYLAAAVGAFASTWSDPLHRAVGIPGDSVLFIWFLRWGAFSLTDHRNPFVTTYVNYPEGANVMWNTSVLLPGWVMAPLTTVAGSVLTFNVLMTLAPALSAWCAMLAIRRWVPGALPATIGGLLYGFSPYIFAQSLGHLHLTLAFYPPLVVLLLGEILVANRRPLLMGALLGVLTVAQLLTGEEMVATTALFVAVGLGWLTILHRRRVPADLRRAAPALGLALLVTLVGAAVPLYFQFFGPQRIHGELQPHNVYVTDLQNFIAPTLFQAIRPAPLVDLAAAWTGNSSEWNAYLGIPLVLLLLGSAVAFWRVKVARLAALAGLSMAVLSLGPRLHVGGVDTGIHLPYRLLDRLPVLGNVLPSRLALFVYLCSAFLLAVFVKRMLTARFQVAALLGLAAVAVALLPLFPSLPWYSVPTTTPAFFTGAVRDRVQPGEVLLVTPAYGGESPLPMLWQAEGGMRYRLPTGYIFVPGMDNGPALGPRPSAISDLVGPVGDGAPVPVVDGARRDAVMADLRRRHVVGVVVGPMKHRAETVQVFTALFGRGPEQVDDVYSWWLR
jgi:hypothetical protein